MYRSVFVTGEKAVEAKRYAAPQYPSFQIGLVAVEDRVVSKTELESAQSKLHKENAKQQAGRVPDPVSILKTQAGSAAAS